MRLMPAVCPGHHREPTAEISILINKLSILINKGGATFTWISTDNLFFLYKRKVIAVLSPMAPVRIW